MSPLTMIFLSLMSFLLLMSAQQYVAEKRFYEETEVIRLQEYYLFCSFKDVESMAKSGALPPNGIFHYQKGSVSYVTSESPPGRKKITFHLSLDSGVSRDAACEYDNEEGKMVKWTEK